MPQRAFLPQFNWAIFGPLVVVLALIVGVSGWVASLTMGDLGDVSVRRTPGQGGGADLRPPELVKSQLFSLSARVNGQPTIRRGPGTQYAAVAKAVDGQEYHVIACSPGCEWLRVFSLNDDGQWWMPAVFVSISGELTQLPILTPTETAGGR